MGQKKKLWITTKSPATGNKERWLVKYVRGPAPGQGSSSSCARGEDWAEGLAHFVTRQLGLPSPCVCLAVDPEGARASLIKDFCKPGQQLIHGSELLVASVQGYEVETPKRENPVYTVNNIMRVLETCSPTEGSGFTTAPGQFAGYLVFDALVAGRDRHHHNWGVLQDAGAQNPPALAPTYDHNNAFGCDIPPHKLTNYVGHPSRLANWARKGKSHHHAGQPSLVDIAAAALKYCCEQPLTGYRDDLDLVLRKLEDLDVQAVQRVAGRIPEHVLPREHVEFIGLLLEENRGRVRDAIRT